MGSAFNLPAALDYLTGKVEPSSNGLYDHGGYEISQTFVDDILARDFYADLDTYKNELLVIHGTKMIQLYHLILVKYMFPSLINKLKFVPIEGANHNYDTVEHIKEVLKLSLDFLTK